MICKKCGMETDDGKFCQHCGSILIQEGELNTENVTEEVNTSVPKMSDEELYSEPYDLTKEMNNTTNENTMSFGIQASKKKKKWPVITGIVAAALIVLGIGTYFAYPMILQMINPKGYAVTALEKTTATMKSSVNGYFDNVDFTKMAQSADVSMNLHLDNMDIAGESLFSEFNGKDIILKMQSTPADQLVSGSIALANGSSSSISIEFYTDGTTLKFKVPKLSSKTFSIATKSMTDSAYSYDQVFDLMDTFSNPSQLQTYMETYSQPIKAAIQDIIKGLDTVIENCKYDKVGNQTLQTDNGDISVSVYEAIITEDAIKKGVVAAINNLYSDKELSSYTGLITMAIGKTKQDLISSVESANLDMVDIPITLYINRDQEVVKYLFDLNKIVNTNGKLSVSFLGKDNIYSYIVSEFDMPGEFIGKIIAKNEDHNFNYSMKFKTVDSYSAVNFDYGVQGNWKKTGEDYTFNFDKLYINANADGDKIDVSMSGNATSKVIPSMTNNSSSFNNAINIDGMSTEQLKTVLNEVYNNSGNLKGLVPDTLITALKTQIAYLLATLR